MSKIDLGVLTNTILSFPKIQTAPKFEQGKTKFKNRHNEFIKTLFVKVDKPDNLSPFDDPSLITLPPSIQKHFGSDYVPYLMNTYTKSSFLESILICFDNELYNCNSENGRKFIIEKYLSAMDLDLKLNYFWKDTPSNKSEFKRQLYGNNKCDSLGKMLSNSLDINIILVDCETNNINFIDDLIFKDEKPILILVKKYGRYFPIMTESGPIFDIKEEEIVSLFEDLNILEKIIKESSSNDDESSD